MARGDYDDMVTDDGNRRLRRGNRRTVLATLFFIIVALIVLVIYLIANPAESVSVTVQNTHTAEKKDTSTADGKKSTLFNFSDTSSSEEKENTETELPGESVTAEEIPSSAPVETATAEESSVTERVTDETSVTQEEVPDTVSVPAEEPQSPAAESETVSPDESEGGALTVTQTIVDVPEETSAPGNEAAVVNITEKAAEETAPEKSDAADEITTESTIEKVVEALSESDNIIDNTIENVSSAFENTEEPASAVEDVISSIEDRIPEGEEAISAVKEIVDSFVAAVIPAEEAAQAEEEVSIPVETPLPQEAVVPQVEESPAPDEEKTENVMAQTPVEEKTENTAYETPVEEDDAVSAEYTPDMEAPAAAGVEVIGNDEVPAIMEMSEEVIIEEETVSPQEITEEPEIVNSVLLIAPEDVVASSSSHIEGDTLVISGKSGSAVKSVAQGTVIEAGRENGRKYVIVLDNNGEAVKYSGFERVTVKVKAKVKEGSVLGSIGSSSDSTITLTPVAVE